MKYTQGDAFDPHEPFVYFIASDTEVLSDALSVNQYLLIGINALSNQRQIDHVLRWYDAGAKVFLDSGVYNLAMTHARRFGVSMVEALNLAPEEIHGFDALYERYVTLCSGELGARCWGYTELDQGGRENKIRIRAQLEGLGLRPIPIYHPLNDGYDYFDTLAGAYDRVAVGNLVNAKPPIRARLAATIWERARAYPDCWTHLLGVTAGPLTLAFPPRSSDSSSWLRARRWGHNAETAMSVPCGLLNDLLVPNQGHADISNQNVQAARLGARLAAHLMQTSRDSMAALSSVLTP